jgi:hypothetical protein
MQAIFLSLVGAYWRAMDAATIKALKEEPLPNQGFLRRAGELFSSLRNVGCERDKAGNRELFFNEYCSWMLFYAMTPIVQSLQALQEASDLKGLQEALGLRRFSMGSFSEAPAVFDADLLEPIAANLALQLQVKAMDPRLQELYFTVHLVDSTLLRTLPKLLKTFYHQRKDGGELHAWRVHLDLQLGLPAPERFTVTGAHGQERQELGRHLRGGCCYVTDRGYQDVSLYNRIHAAGSRYVCRVRENLKFTVLEDLELSAEDRAAGVLADQMVQIAPGRKEQPSHPVRLITLKEEVHPKRIKRHKGVKKLSSGKLLVLSNLSPSEAPAAVVGLLFRYRWSIELFFRFLKQVLGLRHLICQREEAVRILLYCMVICCVLLELWTGERPDLATMRMLQWYLLGVATLAELQKFLARRQQKKAKMPA